MLRVNDAGFQLFQQLQYHASSLSIKSMEETAMSVNHDRYNAGAYSGELSETD